MRTLIKDVKAHDGEIVEICGFVKQVRDKKTMQFAVIRDVTEAVQLTLEKNEQNEAINNHLVAHGGIVGKSNGQSARGRLRETQRRGDLAHQSGDRQLGR